MSDGLLSEDFWADVCHLRPKSLHRLGQCIAQHLRWLRDKDCCWRRATHADLHGYLAALVDGGLADATLRLHRWALWTLYRWAHQAGHRPDNPESHLAPMRQRPHSLRWVPTRAQVELLLNAPDVQTDLGLRDRCILELLYASGMRASELLSLQAWQVNPHQRSFIVVGKGGWERMVIYGETAAEWLHRYLHEARPKLIEQGMKRGAHRGKSKMAGTSALFVHPAPGLAMTYMQLWRTVCRHGHDAGLPLMTPHVLRHAFAWHCHEGGMDLITLQTLLGHASVSTTTIYLHSSPERLRAFLERHHPRGTKYQPFQRGRCLPDK